MMRGLLGFCIRERLLVLLAMLAAAAAGWMALQSVPLDAIPNVGENQVIVLAEWAGRSPRDMEDQVTYPLSVLFLLCWVPWVIGWNPGSAGLYLLFALMGAGISGASLAWALAKDPSLGDDEIGRAHV